MKSISELFSDQVERAGGAVAVECDGERLTYAELDRRSDTFARYLVSLGVEADVRVAVFLQRSVDLLVAMLAILKAGGAYVPLDPTHPRHRLAHVISDSQPKAIVSDARLAEKLPDLGQTRLLDVGAAVAAAEDATLRRPDPGDLAYVIYTSGSTGKPKGVQIEHRSVTNLFGTLRERPGLDAADAVLAITTPAFDISVVELFLPLVCGARVIMAPDATVNDGAAMVDLIDQARPTVIQATPSTFRMLLDAGWGGAPDLKLLCGGEPWTAELAERLLSRCASLWNMYGPTETTVWSAVGQIAAGDPVTIGRPVAKTRLYVLDGARQLLPVGVAGELYIAGQGLARGYLGLPELTRERFVPDPFSPTPEARMYRTGDLVRRTSSGSLEYLDRIDNQVKIRGHRIELGDIEAALKSYPKVKDAVVVARDDTSGDKALVACIILDEGNAVEAGELRSFLLEELPAYMVPNRFVTVEAFPLTPNGKLDRNALSPADAPAVSASTNQDRPRTATEEAIAGIWCEMLGVSDVGMNDNFFDLGGHSLLATRVLARINRLLRVRIGVAAFFRDPTVEALAREAGTCQEIVPRVTPLRAGDAEPPVYFVGVGPAESLLAQRIQMPCAVFGVDFPIQTAWTRPSDAASPPTVEELGELNAKLIYEHAGAKSCLLAGYSMWGRIAFETARALQRRGGNVALVIMLDARPATGGRTMRAAGEAGLRAILGETLTVSPAAALRDALQLARWGIERVPQFVRNRFLPKDRTSGYLDERGEPVLQIHINQLNRSLDARYRPGPLDVGGVLLRTLLPGEELLTGYDVGNGWSELFNRGLEIVQAEGDHFSMIREANVDKVAELMNRFLERYVREEIELEDRALSLGS